MLDEHLLVERKENKNYHVAFSTLLSFSRFCIIESTKP